MMLGLLILINIFNLKIFKVCFFDLKAVDVLFFDLEVINTFIFNLKEKNTLFYNKVINAFFFDLEAYFPVLCLATQLKNFQVSSIDKRKSI